MSKPKKIILCPNPYRDKDMTVAARSKEILDQEGFETAVCLPFQKEGYGAELGGQTCSLPSAATGPFCTWPKRWP